MALIICDTSALILIAECVGNWRKEEKLSIRLAEAFGENYHLFFHPISVVELAGNMHDEIHFRRHRDNEWKEKSTRDARKFEKALIILGTPDDDSGVKLSKISKPNKLTLDDDYWPHLTAGRMFYSSLTCDGGEPRHKLAMADYQIFSLATYLKKKREKVDVGIFTGDNEIITAAVQSRIPWLGVYPNNQVRDWKNCAEDNSCVRGDSSQGGAGCSQRFGGPNQNS